MIGAIMILSKLDRSGGVILQNIFLGQFWCILDHRTVSFTLMKCLLAGALLRAVSAAPII